MKESIGKQDILKLAQNLNGEKDKGDEQKVDVSGVYVNGEVGFPLRVFKEECDKNEGEPKNYEEAYQKACSILRTDNCNSYEEYEFVWFSPQS